jgi:hypothetical protein
MTLLAGLVTAFGVQPGMSGIWWPVAGLWLAAGLAAFGMVTLRDDGGPSAATTPIRLTAIADRDPFGDDGAEHPEAVELATDGNVETYWTTQEYISFDKEGVGIVLDAGREVEPETLTLRTDTEGFTAHIRAGDSPTDFHRVSPGLTVTDGMAFDLVDAKARYFVIWITDLSGVAHVNEVSAR